MTRKDFYTYAKRYGIAVLVAIPILVCINILLANKVSTAWMIVINCVVLLCIYIITLGVVEALKRRTQKKREEFLAKKEQEKHQQPQQEETTEIQTPQKIVQKQKKNYPSKKTKRR